MIDDDLIRSLPREEILDAAARRRLVAAILEPANDDYAGEALVALGVRLIAEDQLDEADALAAVDGLPPWDQGSLTLALAKALHDRGRVADAAERLRTARRAFEEGSQGWQRAQALLEIAGVLRSWGRAEGAAGVVSEAVVAARSDQQSASQQDALDADSVLSEAAEVLAGLGREAEAREVAQSIRSWGYRRRTNRRLVALARRAER